MKSIHVMLVLFAALIPAGGRADVLAGPITTYGVERATSLAGPWVNADTGQTTVASDGKWTFTDTTLTNPSLVFYRLYYPSSATPPQ